MTILPVSRLFDDRNQELVEVSEEPVDTFREGKNLPETRPQREHGVKDPITVFVESTRFVEKGVGGWREEGGGRRCGGGTGNPFFFS